MTRRYQKVTARTIGYIALALFLALGAWGPQVSAAAPSAPNWLPGQPMMAGGQVIAMWLPIPGAVKYIIYLDGKKLTESPANQYMGPAPTEGGEHVFEVTAVDASGAEGPRSAAGKIVVKIIEPPKIPIFRVNDQEKSVLLRWNRPDGATVFNVYRGESAAGPYTMIASVQEEVYKDSGLESGKTYFYTVSSKDILGKESAKSEPAEVKIEVIQAAKQAEAFDLAIVPSRSSRTVAGLSIDDIPMEMPSPTWIKMGPDGKYYMLDRSDKMYVLDGGLNLVELLRFSTPEGIRNLDLYNMAFIDDETALVTDLNNSSVHTVDLSRGVITQTMKLVKPTREQNPKVYEAMAERMRALPAQPLSVALLNDDTIWVADGQGSILHHMTLDGELLDWFCFYINPEDGKERRLSNLPDMMALEDGTVLVSTGVARTILRLEPETKELVYLIGEAASMVGKFIGFGGMTLTPDGTRLVVADPTMHTIQGFDLGSGKYLFSIGGPEKKADPQQETRAMVDYQSPFFPVIPGEKSLVFFNKIEKKFDERTLLEPLPAVKGAE